MVQSKAATVSEYLDAMDPARRHVVESVRARILERIHDGFDEVMNWGMVAYEIPLSQFADTYNGKPLLYCALAAQKRHYAVYLMNVYSGSEYLEMLTKGYESAGVKLDMGKCCVRFRNLEGVHLPTIGEVVGACSVDDFIEIHRSCHGSG